MKEVLAGAVALMAVSMALLALYQKTFAVVWIFIFLFFMAFNLLEATLPSLVSKECRAGSRGTAMGVYSTCQFLGAFIGGAAGGLILQHWGTGPELWAMTIVLLFWLAVVISMPQPSYSTGLEILLSESDIKRVHEVQDLLFAVKGVEDVNIAVQERKAYLKVDKELLDATALENFKLFPGNP
jgi:MFS family permease